MSSGNPEKSNINHKENGNCLENLIKNPALADLIGGIQYVTLSDEEAKRRGTQKSILERKAYPAFQIVIEINEPSSWTIHEEVKNSIDLLLRGTYSINQIRQLGPNEKTSINYNKLQNNSQLSFQSSRNLKNITTLNNNDWTNLNNYNLVRPRNLKTKQLLIYTYSLSNNLIKEAVSKIGIKLILTKEIKKASLIIGLKKHLKQNLKLKKLALQNNIPIYTTNRGSVYQLTKLIQFLFYQKL